MRSTPLREWGGVSAGVTRAVELRPSGPGSVCRDGRDGGLPMDGEWRAKRGACPEPGEGKLWEHRSFSEGLRASCPYTGHQSLLSRAFQGISAPTSRLRWQRTRVLELGNPAGGRGGLVPIRVLGTRLLCHLLLPLSAPMPICTGSGLPLRPPGHRCVEDGAPGEERLLLCLKRPIRSLP